jgi:hypothetical protein
LLHLLHFQAVQSNGLLLFGKNCIFFYLYDNASCIFCMYVLLFLGNMVLISTLSIPFMILKVSTISGLILLGVLIYCHMLCCVFALFVFVLCTYIYVVSFSGLCFIDFPFVRYSLMFIYKDLNLNKEDNSSKKE